MSKDQLTALLRYRVQQANETFHEAGLVGWALVHR